MGRLRVRIIGPPRSGTNLLKYLAARHLPVDVVFNEGFWKHGVFPALVDGGRLSYGGLPMLVLSRDPISQIVAWHRLAITTRHIFGQVGSLHDFVRGPMAMELKSYPPHTIRFRFARPIEYWNQFYVPLLSLRSSGAPVHFIRYEDMARTPDLVLRAIAGFLGVEMSDGSDAAVTLPGQALVMTNDHDGVAGENMLNAVQSFHPGSSGFEASVRQLGRRASLEILRSAAPDVLAATDRSDYADVVQRALGGWWRFRWPL